MVNTLVAIFLCGLALIGAAEPKNEDVLQDLQRIDQIRSLGLQFAHFFRNATITDLSLPDPRAPTAQDYLCLQELADFSMALSTGQYWALKMIDSWGFLPSGVLTGNFYDLGNFDECVNIQAKGIQSSTIHGKYCFLTVSPGEILGITTGVARRLSVKTATCFPSSCSGSHMNQFIAQIVERVLNLNIPSTALKINDSGCQTNEVEPLDGLTIFTIVILSVMAAAVLLFTTYDYLLCENQNQLPILVKMFSARANARVIFRIVDSKSNPNVIDCLHGIRCLSLFWVVYSHDYIYSAILPNINMSSALTWMEQPFSSFILHGFFSVDSFFFLGGMLLTLISLRSMEKTKGKLNVPLMYLHRLIRIVPIMAIAILVYVKIMPIVSGGPLFKGGYSGREGCEKGWYWSLLFVQNYTNEICLGQTWYLAVDMQLFLISPILLIALYKWGKKAAGGIFVLMILFSGCLFATQIVNDYHMLLRYTSTEASKKLYFATHTHAAPWLIGFLFGYFLHLNRGRKFQLSKVAVWSGWVLCLALIFTSIFALYPAGKWDAEPLPLVADASYYTLTRIAWPLTLCWVVFACMQGYGGMANSFLSSPVWQPLSRISYSVYIWHMFVQEVNNRSTRTNTYFTDYQVMLRFWSDLGITIIMAVILYLIIEAPFGGLEYFLRSPTKKTGLSKEASPSIATQQTDVSEKDPSNLDRPTILAVSSNTA
ncbi:nose resistant to fluoxetine protein 6 [Drosophila bipectinata]|uniref:nose resistant to fluoxetine protein 6 n=1 Tax=Drosophila bipectinata TaxID=42026 RepID=UPI001C8A6FEA|nr:nose resistant to fluoxetine protein 6 [Drosophila bipectinata]